ncbi:MAG: acyltransferase [Burkholderiaceae bacterium]|nr:acyltransferase [Burkholderiaceae bacterium]
MWQFVIVLPGARIGEDCDICSHCLIENDVIIGNRVTVKSGVQLWDGLRVGDDVFIGPNVTFTNDKHPKSGNVNFKLLSTRIEAGASIGGGATFLPGLSIGANATVGAGAVVTKDVPSGATVIGNPASVISQTNSKEIL